MLKSRTIVLIVCAVVALAVACGPGTDPEQEAREQEWQWLQQTKQELDAKRAELAQLASRAAAAEEPEAEGEEGTGAEATAEGEEAEEAEAVDLAARMSALDEEITALSEQFTSRLVAFLNEDPIVEGQPPTERQLAALRMKSDEDMILAQEWIDKGGDYKRAIDIYNSALQLDPDNERLQAALAEAEGNRYMTEERFAQAEKGMSREEVRALLGQPNLHNIREYADRGVVAWFYPTNESGDAAGVWFEVNDETGESSAYQLKYDAIRHEEAAEEEAG